VSSLLTEQSDLLLFDPQDQIAKSGGWLSGGWLALYYFLGGGGGPRAINSSAVV
jgi:hypothetical protein